MRTVLITDEVSADIADAIAFAHEHGIDEIALRGVSEQNIVALGEPALDALLTEVNALGMRVTSVLSPLFKAYLPGRAGPSLDDPNVPQFSVDASIHLALRDRLPALAARFGADCVRVFSFLTEPGAEARLHGEARDLMMQLEQSHAGLYAVENEDVCFVQTVADLERCTLETGLRGILDPANDWYVTREAVAPRITAGLVERLADVHVKDMAGEDCVPFGEGEVDWPAILTRLGELGYRGTLTHEPHIGRDRDGVARAIEALRRHAH
jgi:sugar phosphate isomerase/epimerase